MSSQIERTPLNAQLDVRRKQGNYQLLEKQITQNRKCSHWDFLGGTVVKNLPANAGDTGLSPGPGRSHMARSN